MPRVELVGREAGRELREQIGRSGGAVRGGGGTVALAEEHAPEPVVVTRLPDGAAEGLAVQVVQRRPPRLLAEAAERLAGGGLVADPEQLGLGVPREALEVGGALDPAHRFEG